MKYKYKYMALFWEKYLSKMQVLLEVFKYKYKYKYRAWKIFVGEDFGEPYK